MTKNKYGSIIHYIILSLLSCTFIIPFLLVIIISFSSEKSIDIAGYTLFPVEWSLEAYRTLFRNPQQIFDAYAVTIFYSIIGTLLALLTMSLVAYPLAKKDFRYRRPITLFLAFTMLFSGGMIPTYILNTQYLHLDNTIFIYLLSGLASAWHIVIIRTFFQGLPPELMESAKIDGASEMKIFFRIILPLSKPVLATIGLMTLLGKWNDWMTSMLYIRNERLYSLQYLLQRVLRETEFINDMAKNSATSMFAANFEVPSESMRFALAVVAAGPMLCVFPFFQKYFAKGLTVGAVKG